MSAVEHEPGGDPFATGGGGTTFEYNVDAWFAKDILTHRTTTVGGRITRLTLHPQVVPEFDDARLEVERDSGERLTIDVQIRYRQRLTSGDAKFRALLMAALTEVNAHPEEFAKRRRTLLLVVSATSPAHRDFRRLIRLASSSLDVGDFERQLARAPKRIRQRLENVSRAIDTLSAAILRQLLSALAIVALDLEGDDSPVIAQAINELAELWTPPNIPAGKATFDRLFSVIASRDHHAEAIDEELLQTLVGNGVPRSRLASSRRMRLQHLRAAAFYRVVGKLVTLGLLDEAAERVAEQALSIPAALPDGRVVVVTGEIGVGKSTELQRLVRQAAGRALEDPASPVPVYIHASDLRTRALRPLLVEASEGIGRPESVGIFAVIDGLDEAGRSAEQILPEAYSIANEWPGSRLILGTRDAGTSQAVQVHRIEPLSDGAYARLMESLGAPARHLVGIRPALVEALRRPLFAILDGLRLKSGQPGARSASQLINDLAERTVAEVATESPDAIATLTELGAKLVETEGSVALRSLGISAVDRPILRRSRVIAISGGRARFQLAALGEWFAAHHVLHSPSVAAAIASNPIRMTRWRYVMAQALSQATQDQAEDLLEILTTRGATALIPWILDEAASAFPSDSPVEVSTSAEAASHVRRALSVLASATLPASRSLRGMDADGQPEVGVSVDGDQLALAVPIRSPLPSGLAGHKIFAPRPSTEFAPSEPGVDWLPYMFGPRPEGPTWAWAWPARECATHVTSGVISGTITAPVQGFKKELIWRFAQAMLGHNNLRLSAPIVVSDLEAAIDKVKDRVPAAGDVRIRHGRDEWRLADGEHFLRELKKLDITQIDCPWTPPDRMGDQISQWWSPGQLIARLNEVGPVALDGYQQLVDSWFPAFAPFLPIYLLLPATVRGFVWVHPDASEPAGPSRFAWFIEPCDGQQNRAQWERVDRQEDVASSVNLDEVREKLRERRPTHQVFPGLRIHYGEPEVFTTSPASRLARRLLHAELYDLKWCTSNLPAATDDPVVAPEI